MSKRCKCDFYVEKLSLIEKRAMKALEMLGKPVYLGNKEIDPYFAVKAGIGEPQLSGISPWSLVERLCEIAVEKR